MKFTLFVLIIGFSYLLAASLTDGSSTASLNTALDYPGLANDFAENDYMKRFLNPWPALNKIFRKILSVRTRIRCAAKEICVISKAISKFIIDIGRCDDSDADDVGTLNTTGNAIITDIDDILNELNTVSTTNEDTKRTAETAAEFSEELYDKNIQLKDKIFETIELIEGLPVTGVCTTNALNDLHGVLLQFPTAMENCLQN